MAGTSRTVVGKTKLKLSKQKLAIVVAGWNESITESLFQGAFDAFIKLGVKKSNIIRKNVPGSFELPLAAQWMAKKKQVAGVVCLGCVIEGDTPHFKYVCQGVTYGIMRASLSTNKPISFGVLTTLNQQQAEDRAGGRLGNKGEEAALTVIKMLEIKK